MAKRERTSQTSTGGRRTGRLVVGILITWVLAGAIVGVWGRVHRVDDGWVRERMMQADFAYGIGRYAEAASLYGEVAARTHGDPAALLWQANAMFRVGDFEGARRVYESLLRLGPSPVAEFNLAQALRRAGSRDEGEAILRAFPGRWGALLPVGARRARRALGMTVAGVGDGGGAGQAVGVVTDLRFFLASPFALESALRR